MKDIFALVVAALLIACSYTMIKRFNLLAYSLSALLGIIAFVALGLLEDRAWFSQAARAILFSGFSSTIIGFALKDKRDKQRR
jgi:predicted tellurium resistance membrane protein TerC